MWLALGDTIAVADALVGALVATGAVLALSRLDAPPSGWRHPWTAVKLAATVAGDIARSNVAVATIVLRRGTRGRVAGFIDVPLDLRHTAGLAVLACIITATPGTTWAGYDARSGTLTMHILDLVDEAALVRAVKERYERPLREIFE
ncbi:MAG: monovalent cation/H+ antiporter subunit E [Burkholderiales bacterium]|nr:monovalent cation/H+ antiporter subunit E [Burkholderiales bacterium]